MQIVQLGSSQRYTAIYRRGVEFYDEVQVVQINPDPPTEDLDDPYPAVDLNGCAIKAEIRSGNDLQGTLIASLWVLPVDLTNGIFAFAQTPDETDAFDPTISGGGFYVYINGDVTDGLDFVLLTGTLIVKDPDDP